MVARAESSRCWVGGKSRNAARLPPRHLLYGFTAPSMNGFNNTSHRRTDTTNTDTNDSAITNRIKKFTCWHIHPAHPSTRQPPDPPTHQSTNPPIHQPTNPPPGQPTNHPPSHLQTDRQTHPATQPPTRQQWKKTKHHRLSYPNPIFIVTCPFNLGPKRVKVYCGQ